MHVVGVKDLKANLSAWLRRVRTGETVLVTDRNLVVAELRPVAPRPAPRGDIQDVLAGLAESGEVTRPTLSARGWTWSPPGLGLPPGTAAHLMAKGRADRENGDAP